MNEPTEEIVKPEDWKRYKDSEARLQEAQLKVTHAQEIYKLMAELIMVRYNISPTDKITTDGKIIRVAAENKSEIKPEPIKSNA